MGTPRGKLAAVTAASFLCATLATAAAQERPPGAAEPSPAIDCVKDRSALALAVCHDKAATAAAHRAATTYLALYFSLEESKRAAFRTEHMAWLSGLGAACTAPAGNPVLPGASPPPSGPAPDCLKRMLGQKADAYRKRLDAAALEEINLPPLTQKKIQKRLIELKLMSGGADGMFGAGTRVAIRSFQASAGHAQTGFLTAEERGMLLAQAPPAAPAQVAAPAPAGAAEPTPPAPAPEAAAPAPAAPPAPPPAAAAAPAAPPAAPVAAAPQPAAPPQAAVPATEPPAAAPPAAAPPASSEAAPVQDAAAGAAPAAAAPAAEAPAPAAEAPPHTRVAVLRLIANLWSYSTQVAGFVAVLVLALGAFFLVRRRRRNRLIIEGDEANRIPPTLPTEPSAEPAAMPSVPSISWQPGTLAQPEAPPAPGDPPISVSAGSRW
jgi:peptidoglycan hydrolase-like protein with peptidoglycan-binding domain